MERVTVIRNGSKFGDSSVRARRTPKLNTKATSLLDMISWTGAHEPSLVCRVPTDELVKLAKEPMAVPKFPVHGQSIERCVKHVTAASKSVYGQEKRDGFVRAGFLHRKLLPQVRSKQDLKKMCERIKLS